MENKIKINALFPVLFSFFVMGFVDMVGISVSYVKEDFSLNDKIANLLPMMVFVWFAVFSLPTGRLLGKLGRKNTIAVNEKMQSSISTIFAGGDIVRGGATVILAMGDGRKAAKNMHEMLTAQQK